MRSEHEYEFEERAAIRQFDGGQDQAAAEGLAGSDLAARDDEFARLQTLRAGSDVEAMKKARESVRRAWQAATDPDEGRRLNLRWQELCMKIVQLKVKD